MPPAPAGPSQQFENSDVPGDVFFVSAENSEDLVAKVHSCTEGLEPELVKSSMDRARRILGIMSVGEVKS